jgi:ankyrin repeat protein
LNYVIYHIETGANPNQRNEKNKKTLLYIATERGDYQVVKFLIEKGAEINAKSENQTPLHIAYKKEHWEIFHILVLNGAVFEPKLRKTLLYIATEINDYQLVKYLIEKGEEINAKSDLATRFCIFFFFFLINFMILIKFPWARF